MNENTYQTHNGVLSNLKANVEIHFEVSMPTGTWMPPPPLDLRHDDIFLGEFMDTEHFKEGAGATRDLYPSRVQGRQQSVA